MGPFPLAVQGWYQQQQGSVRDLPALYMQIIAAIREVDPSTPVMVDAGWSDQEMLALGIMRVYTRNYVDQ